MFSNPTDPLNPLNPLHPLNPLNPLHPLNPFNPASPLNPINALNPAHPLNSVQSTTPSSTIKNSKSQEDQFLKRIKNNWPTDKKDCDNFRFFYQEEIDAICNTPDKHQSDECKDIKNLILQCK